MCPCIVPLAQLHTAFNDHCARGTHPPGCCGHTHLAIAYPVVVLHNLKVLVEGEWWGEGRLEGCVLTCKMFTEYAEKNLQTNSQSRQTVRLDPVARRGGGCHNSDLYVVCVSRWEYEVMWEGVGEGAVCLHTNLGGVEEGES